MEIYKVIHYRMKMFGCHVNRLRPLTRNYVMVIDHRVGITLKRLTKL